MKINDWYEFEKLRKNELTTLKSFIDMPAFAESFPALYNDAKITHPQLAQSKSSVFSFKSELAIQIEGKLGKAYFGAQSFVDNSGNFEGLSYYVTICKNDQDMGQLRVIRKYHFDYALPTNHRRQPHPVFHLQYAGKLPPHLSSIGIGYCENCRMDDWLSEPRLYFMPMSLALLVNIILKEFPDEGTQGIIERSEWRDLIRKNESLLLVPYFKCCHNFFSNRNSTQLFTNDFCYGN